MRLMPSFLVLSALAALTAMSGCATTQPQSQYAEDYAAWQSRLTAALKAHGDTDSLVALALLRRSVTEPRDHPDAIALDALNAAAKAAPERPAVAALWLQACLAAEACDAAEAAAHVRRIDPGNGIADWAPLRAAMLSDDAARIDAALAALADAQSFNVYFNGYLVAAVDALTRTRLPAEPQLQRAGESREWLFVAMDGSSLYTTAAMRDIATACNERAPSAARRANCLRMYATLLRSDTMVLQSFAANQILLRSLRGSAQAAAATELRRRLDWYNEGLNGAMTPWRLDRVPAELLAALRSHAREEDARRAVLTNLKVALDPPKDWMPRAEPVTARD